LDQKTNPEENSICLENSLAAQLDIFLANIQNNQEQMLALQALH
jgi:hypothetical protein